MTHCLFYQTTHLMAQFPASYTHNTGTIVYKTVCFFVQCKLTCFACSTLRIIHWPYCTFQWSCFVCYAITKNACLYYWTVHTGLQKIDGTLEIHKRFIFLQSDCCNVVYVLFGCGCVVCHYLHRDGQKATPLSGTHPGRRDKATHEIQQQVKSRV